MNKSNQMNAFWERFQHWTRWGGFALILTVFWGCESTNSGTTQVTGQLREPLTEWDVDIYQNPPGLLSWVIDMEIPAKFEQVAVLESEGETSATGPGAIDEKTQNMVSDLKKRAAKMGANAIIIRAVTVVEDVVEDRSPSYQTVRYPDGSIAQVEGPDRISYRRVFRINMVAESVFLDWNTVWTGT